MNRTSFSIGRDPGRVRARLERVAARFEAACGSDSEWPELDAYLAEADGGWRNDLLVELIHADLELRVRFGKPSRLAELLKRHFPDGEPAEIVTALELRERELMEDWGAGPRPESDRFTLGEELGRGATSIVYRGFDERLRRVVAFKRLRSELLDSEGAVRRFLREARHTAVLRHPGIVRLFEAGRTDGCCFLVMELVPGESLARRMDAGRYTPRRAVELVARVADALEHAHACGIVHRDVKPSNILLDADGRPYLSDFGLAYQPAGDCTLTEDGQVLGTPAYMSPEQARGDVHRIDRRSDVYSLGVILYELLTGVVPFRGIPRMVLAQVIEEDPRPPRRLDDSIPRDLETICLKAVSKDPSRRYQRAGDFAADLGRWLDGRPVSARPVGAPARLWLRCRRRPALSGLGIALVLTLLGLAGTYVKARTHLEDARRQAARFREGMDSSSRIASGLATMVPAASAPGFDEARLKSAIVQFKERIALIESDPGCRDILARDLIILRSLYDRCDRVEEAVAAQRLAVQALESLPETGMDTVRLSETAGAVSVLARLLARAGRADQAREASAKAFDLDMRAQARWRDSGEADLVRDPYRLGSLLRLAEFNMEQGRIGEAVSMLKEAVAFAGRRPPKSPVGAAKFRLIERSLRLGRGLHDRGRSEEAARLLESAGGFGLTLARGDGGEPAEKALVSSGKCLLEAARIHSRRRDRDAAARTFRLARTCADELTARGRSSPRSQRTLAKHFVMLAKAADALDDPDAAILAFGQALEAYRAMHSQGGDPHKALSGIAMCHHVIGRIRSEQGRLDEARQALRAALEIRRDVLRNHVPTKIDADDFEGTRKRLAEVEAKLRACPISREAAALEGPRRQPRESDAVQDSAPIHSASEPWRGEF